jgi:DNA-binding transcriptional MerR regulator
MVLGTPVTSGQKEPPGPLFFKIGEAAARVGVTSHVLRYWAKEFPQIQPSRVGGHHRLFRAEDIRIFLEIKHLLYEERFTIEGARKRLEELSSPAQPPPVSAQTSESKPSDSLLWAEIRQELISIRRLLAAPARSSAEGQEG